MWQRLLALLAATKRPLVFVDFETAGLGGAPPVEYAVAYWAPWAPLEMDDASVAARKNAPPGITYATTMRVDPCCAIHPKAQAVHGITAEMLKGCPKYNDIEVVGFFQALANGDTDTGEGPAIWGGHNVAEADIPWAQRWGYLPAGVIPCVDTQRMFRRLVKSHPFPVAPDAILPGAKVPAVGHGLTPYASSLVGVHTALSGDPHSGSHGALADVLASAWCFMAMLEMWAPLWPAPVQGEDPHAALDALLGDKLRVRARIEQQRGEPLELGDFQR
jgi:DNA polymerase III epsilon subunit-like protein